MLRRITFIARKEFQYFWTDWESYLWVLVMPILFTYFVGTVTSQFGGADQTGGRAVIAVLVPENAGFLADQVVRRLKQNGYDVHQHQAREPLVGYARRLIIPERFTDTALGGQTAVVRFEQRPGGLVQEHDQFRVRRAVYTVLADLVVCDDQERTPDAAVFDALQQTPRSLTLSVRTAGQRTKTPTGFEQAVPGVMIMFSMAVVLASTSAAVVIEREQGLLKRLASAPLTRGEIFTGKWIARLAIGYVQVVLGLVAGTVLFGVGWGGDLPMVLLVALAWSAFCASLGLLLGNLVRTEAQGIGASVLGANFLCALGGQWWPIEVTPAWMQKLAMCLPTGWTMDALHQLALFRAEAPAVIPHLSALFVASAIIGLWGARTFRFF